MQVPFIGLVTLMELLRIYARSYLDIGSRLEQMLQRIPEIQVYPPPVIGPDARAFFLETLDVIWRESDQCSFLVTADLIRWAIRALNEGTIQYEADLRCKAEAIMEAFQSETSRALLLHVPSGQAAYYQLKHGFEDRVATAFPSARFDIEQAGSCYALNRNTACVFHLMRVMETGLRALGKSLNDPRLNPKNNPNWETILRKCDEELKKSLGDRDPLWRSSEHFFSEATANLRAVKDAWRNPTIHVEINYDDGQAKAVYDSVGAFMRHLAGGLHEEK